MKTHKSLNYKMIELVHRIWLYKPLLFSCLILLALAFSFGSCQKTDSQFAIVSGKLQDTATVKHGDDTKLLLHATAKVGSIEGASPHENIYWYLQVSAKELLFPIELPTSFQLPGMWVNLTYYRTNIPAPASLGKGKFKIKIVFIEKTNEQVP